MYNISWPPKSVALTSDHAAVSLRSQLRELLTQQGITVIETGPQEGERVDYPDTSAPVAAAILEGEVDAAIVLCGSGIGQSMTLNRFSGVRAALAHNVETATLSRQHNDANVLVLGARTCDDATNLDAAKAFLATAFEGDRHLDRIKKIDSNVEGYPLMHDASLLADEDPEIYATIAREQVRQEFGLEMIASENIASPAVMAAMGSVLTNKYAEGYPSKRYYGGCVHVDETETLAIERVKEIFGAKYANVQPHSGSQANFAAYMAICNPGDKVLGMDLSNGGHLTHGAKVNFSGQLFDVHFYGIDDETGVINYEALAAKAKEVQPQVIVAGASAYPRIIDFAKFKEIADSVGAKLFVDMAHIAGLVAAGLHPNPMEYADVVTSTTHKTLRGPRGGIILTNDEAIAKKVNSKIFPGSQGGPLMHTIAAKAVAFKEALDPSFKTYMQDVADNAKRLATILQDRGLSLVTSGTDNHLVLVDLGSDSITGKEGEHLLEEAGITTNKNTVPNETRSPFVTSGLRIGTPAITSRGIRGEAMDQVAHWIADVLLNPEDSAKHAQIKADVEVMCREYPLYRFPQS